MKGSEHQILIPFNVWKSREKVWDTRSLTETVIYLGYVSPPRLEETNNRVSNHDKIHSIMKEKKPLFSVYDINETRNGLISLFKTETIPEINILKIYTPTRIRIGNCAIQRSQFAYRIRAKIRVRRIKKRESPPLTLNNLKFNSKFNYTISFKCTLCKNHVTMRIRDLKAKRKTPICKEHKQVMYIQKVTKKRPKNDGNISIPKIIYEVDH